MKTPSLVRLADLALLADCQARLWMEEGRAREAAELLLDMIQVGCDLRRNSVMISDMIGVSVIGAALQDFPAVLPLLRADDLEKVGRELEILDANWPDFGDTLRNAALSTQTDLLNGARGIPVDDPTFLESARYFFSRRLMEADAGAQIHGRVERTSRLESLDWRERLVEESIDRERRDSVNPLDRNVGSSFVRASASVRHRRAQIRMLREAVGWLRTGSVPHIDDPFGAKLRHLIDGRKLRIWSLGRDGEDQGGKGEWDYATGRDIVLELSR